MSGRLVKIVEKKYKITCLTGLHIGGSKDNLQIGGIDNPVIKHPLTDEPYIPGSSLKGKIRSLLEISGNASNNYFEKNGKKPCNCGECLVCKLFGTSAQTAQSVTRIIVRDGYLSESYKEEMVSYGGFITEEKVENSIDRVSGKADNPRHTERVPAKAEFTVEVSFRIFEGDKEDELINLWKKGIKILEKDYLGGNGSRGYGQVKIEEVESQDFLVGSDG